MELKPLEALKLWHDVELDLVRDNRPDLSLRQIVILLTVYLEPPPHTVRGLAKKLGISKPAITRALDTMGRLDLLKRKRDESDKRNVLIQRTVTGSVYLTDLADSVITRAREIGPRETAKPSQASTNEASSSTADESKNTTP